MPDEHELGQPYIIEYKARRHFPLAAADVRCCKPVLYFKIIERTNGSFVPGVAKSTVATAVAI